MTKKDDLIERALALGIPVIARDTVHDLERWIAQQEGLVANGPDASSSSFQGYDPGRARG